MSHIKDDIKLIKSNYSFINPINKNDVKRKKINGDYIYEQFYIINFYGIKENSYVISSFGRIFSLINNIEMKTNRNKKNGYERVTLRTNKGARTFAVHCLVARVFIPKTSTDVKLNRLYVHHKNWDNSYNYYWNLEWRSNIEIKTISAIAKNKDIHEDELAKMVCKLLEIKTPISEIFEVLGGKVSKFRISKIKNKISYRTISRNYNF